MQELIRIENLWKLFGGNPSLKLEHRRLDPSVRTAVQDVSLSIKEGEIFVLMGLSGSGKSTLLRMLNGLIQPTSGSIDVLGQNLSSLNRKQWMVLRRQTMAMVFQSFALFPHRNALENAAFGLEVAGIPKGKRLQRAREALERVGLGDDLNRKPSQLSGGMRQRVGLARALALDPPILLMDEAFSALDPLIRRDMQDLLLDLQKERRRTVVFVSHDLDEAVRLGDRIAVMQQGQLLQCDSAEALLLHPTSNAVREFLRVWIEPRSSTWGRFSRMNPTRSSALQTTAIDTTHAPASMPQHCCAMPFPSSLRPMVPSTSSTNWDR